MSSATTNPRVVFQERVEVRKAVFDDESAQTQKDSDIQWASGETKRKQIERSEVN
jgi:hypothetical protein